MLLEFTKKAAIRNIQTTHSTNVPNEKAVRRIEVRVSNCEIGAL